MQQRVAMRSTLPTVAYEDAGVVDALRKLESLRTSVQRWADEREYLESGTDRLYQILEDTTKR